MALLTKDEAYNWLKVFLKDGFETNDSEQSVRVKKQLSKKEIDGILCDVYNLLGSKELPHPKNEDEIKALYQNFKLSPDHLPVDKETITVNKYGLLQANIDKIADNDAVVAALAENKKFLAKVKEYMKPELGNAYSVGMLLLQSPAFMRMLTSIVTLIQKNDDKAAEGVSVETIIRRYFDSLQYSGDTSATETTASSTEDESSEGDSESGTATEELQQPQQES